MLRIFPYRSQDYPGQPKHRPTGVQGSALERQTKAEALNSKCATPADTMLKAAVPHLRVR